MLESNRFLNITMPDLNSQTHLDVIENSNYILAAEKFTTKVNSEILPTYRDQGLNCAAILPLGFLEGPDTYLRRLNRDRYPRTGEHIKDADAFDIAPIEFDEGFTEGV